MCDVFYWEDCREREAAQQLSSEVLGTLVGTGDSSISLFLCGDVMTGRGVDQILPYPSDPVLHELIAKSAEKYVQLAEKKNGSIPRSASFSYVWGDAITWLEKLKPDLRIINLETAITESENYCKSKTIHYRMNPMNLPCLTAAKIDCCVLANNHVVDWGFSGLVETVKMLAKARIKCCGAGLNTKEAEAPAVMDVKRKGRVLVFSVGWRSSWIPADWVALEDRPGVNLIDGLSNKSFLRLKRKIEEFKRDGDVVIVSIHWGANWGYNIPSVQKYFAHRLIDQAQVDLVHGHSSHHIKGFEVYKNKLILYGCGDFLNDYEGISPFSYSRWRSVTKIINSDLGKALLKGPSIVLTRMRSQRSDLGLMYFVKIDPGSGNFLCLDMVPIQIRHFRVNNISQSNAKWIRRLLEREEKRFGCNIEVKEDNLLSMSLEKCAQAQRI